LSAWANWKHSPKKQRRVPKPGGLKPNLQAAEVIGLDRYATRNGLDRRLELDLAHSFPPNCCGRRDKLPRSTVPGFASRKGGMPIDLVTSLVCLQGENFSLTSDRKVGARNSFLARHVSVQRCRVIGCLPASRDRRRSTGSKSSSSIVRSRSGRSRGFSINAATPAAAASGY